MAAKDNMGLKSATFHIKNNNMKSFFVILLILLTSNSCKNMRELAQLKSYKNLELYELSGKQSDTTSPNKKYVEGYEVVRSYPLTQDQRKMIVNELLNDENYIKETAKCKMEPSYALNSKDKLLVLFDFEYCPKLVYYGSDTTVRLDIATENTIKRVIESVKSANK